MKISKIRWLVGAEHQLIPLDFGGPPILAIFFAKSWVRHWYGVTVIALFEQIMPVIIILMLNKLLVKDRNFLPKNVKHNMCHCNLS